MGVFWWCWAVFVFPGMLMRAMAACVIALDALGGLALVLSEAGLKPELDIEVILVGICPNKSRHRSSIAIPLLLFISINTIIHYLSPIKNINSPNIGLPIPNTRTTIRNYKPNILISN